MYDACGFAQFLVGWIGLEKAAEPLPAQLLALFFISPHLQNVMQEVGERGPDSVE